MKQHPIDLLPASVRERDRARQRRGRLALAATVLTAMLIVMSTLANIQAARARDRLVNMETRAAHVLALEARAVELRTRLEDLRLIMSEYETAAHPLEVGDIVATVVNLLPTSVTLDHLLVNAGRRRHVRSARSRGNENQDGPAPRMLTGELGGFAVNDSDIAELVDRLATHEVLEDVNLDFSRSRRVRGMQAREFRLSFSIDLERPWLVSRGEQAVAEVTP